MFMRRIAHCKGGGHGKRIDLAGHGVERNVKGCCVQRQAFVAVVVVTAIDDVHRHAGKCLGDSGALDHGGIEAHQQYAHRAAMPFHDGIGRQCGRYRHQADIARVQPLRQLGHRQRDRLGHADGQVALGGDRLGPRHHLVPKGFDNGRVGIGAAGIDTDQIGSRGRSHAIFG